MLWAQWITSGLNTNFNLSPSYLFHTSRKSGGGRRESTNLSFFLSNHSSNSVNNFGLQNQKNNSTCFEAYLYSVGTQHENLQSAGWPILFCGPTQEPVLATANTEKNRERFWKNAGEWTGRVEICLSVTLHTSRLKPTTKFLQHSYFKHTHTHTHKITHNISTKP